MFSTSSIEEGIDKTLEIIFITLCLIGIISNLLSIIICLQKRLRKSPTFVFMMFRNITNIVLLIAVVFFKFTGGFFKPQARSLKFNLSKVQMFLIFSSFQSSAYLQVIFKIYKILCKLYAFFYSL